MTDAAATIMLQGTGSDVGKSLLVSGLCRAYARQGLRVRPFKPQNMSNNAAVTVDGGEIGRAQALQARAAGVPASVHMNPVLLKPQSDVGAQVVVQGQVWGERQARAYQDPATKGALMKAVLDSFDRVREGVDLVIVEGAGSPAEINLRQGDIANMGFARAAEVPVVLVGDIERGGVIASIVGTHHVLSAADRACLAGYIINKFRGDISLFDGGLTAIAERTGLPHFGTVPWFKDASRLPSEDTVAVESQPAPRLNSHGLFRVVVPMLSRIANFDDLNPLAAEPGVQVVFVPPGQPLPVGAQLVVLPGTKATLADLTFFRAQGWDLDLRVHLRHGGHVLGLCGGFQMLGRAVRDPDGVEGNVSTASGLGLLDIDTVLTGRKTLTQVEGVHVASGESVEGYEIHVGATSGPGLQQPMLHLNNGRRDGAVSPCGKVAGCYMHGLFAADGFRHAFLAQLGWRGVASRERLACYEGMVDHVLDGLANHLSRHLNLAGLWRLARGLGV